MATDYFAAKRAQLAPIGTTSSAAATNANVTPGKTAVPKAPIGGSLISHVANKVSGKVPLAPVSSTSTSVPTTKTTIPTAPIPNAMTSTTTPATGFGGATYGPGNTAANSAIAANESALKNTPGYIQSEIDRTLGVIKAREDAGMDTSEQQKYLTTNLKYQPAPVSTGPEVPDWVTAGAKVDLENELAAYRGLSDTYNNQLTSALNQNNNYIAQQIDSAQQFQNRRGGLYSGGYDYQAGTLNAEGLQRQAELQNQYGNQISTIAQQIANLQKAQPALLQEKINAYLDREFDKDLATKQYNLSADNQSFNQGMTTKQFNVDTALQYGDRSGQVLSPQNDPTGYLRQINSGVTSAGTPIGQTLEASNADRNYNYLVGRDKVGDAQWQSEFNYRVQQDGIQNALQWAQQTLNETEASNNNAYRNSSLALDREKFNYGKDQDKLDREDAALASSSKQTELNSKTSTDNYNYLLSDLKNDKSVKREEALQLIQANGEYLSDADYRKLYDWVNENIE